jgi:hypothetical protein
MRTALAAATAIAGFAAFPAQAATPREQEIVGLLNKAINQVYRAAPSCRPQDPLKHDVTATDADPSQDLLNTFAFFRRPATAEEAALKPPAHYLPADGVYRRYMRIATSASGRRILIYAAQNVHFYKPRPQRCIDALRRDYKTILEGRTKAFKRDADKVLEQVIGSEWGGKAQTPAEGLFMETYGSGPGGGGGGSDVAYVRTHGMWFSGGGPSGSVLDGLLPDGVAKVRVHFGPSRVPEPLAGKVRPQPRPKTRTAVVRDNVVSLRISRTAIAAFPDRMTWYAADGSVLRVVK